MSKKILLLADTASSHTEKWATALAEKGYTVGLFSLNKTKIQWYANKKNIVVLNEPAQFSNTEKLNIKLKYILFFPKLLAVIKAFKPDVVHAHYATSYGFLGALSRFKPFVLSVWGSDVFDFPKRSFFHRALLKFNLKHADKLLSTSHAMKEELSKYTSKEINVIPFGVDTEVFFPENVKKPYEQNTIYIGTIKAIEEKYGIDTIIKAIQLVKLSFPSMDFKVFLIGSGNQLAYYKELIDCLCLSNNIIFTGRIPFANVAHYHNLLDIFLNVSIVNESFGVSVIEAMACEKPVIVTKVAGLTEIVNKDIGIIVEKENAFQLADAIKMLILAPEMRVRLGKRARKHVIDNYDFKHCLLQTTDLYASLCTHEEEYIYEDKFKVALNSKHD